MYFTLKLCDFQSIHNSKVILKIYNNNNCNRLCKKYQFQQQSKFSSVSYFACEALHFSYLLGCPNDNRPSVDWEEQLGCCINSYIWGCPTVSHPSVGWEEWSGCCINYYLWGCPIVSHPSVGWEEWSGCCINYYLWGCPIVSHPSVGWEEWWSCCTNSDLSGCPIVSHPSVGWEDSFGCCVNWGLNTLLGDNCHQTIAIIVIGIPHYRTILVSEEKNWYMSCIAQCLLQKEWKRKPYRVTFHMHLQ